MQKNTDLGLRQIRRVLISVWDKTGLVEFARKLKEFNVEIISTGGTAKILRDSGVDVREVSDVTGFPEMMDGRVKTLHPRIHGGLLGLRNDPQHMAAMQKHEIEPIDMVVVNLYPFKQTISNPNATVEQAIEQIDIGGPAMIRSAAKNWKDVTIVIAPRLYSQIGGEMDRYKGAITIDSRARLARLAFQQTSAYDAAVFDYLTKISKSDLIDEHSVEERPLSDAFTVTELVATGRRSGSTDATTLPDQFELRPSKVADLRYGENPHQLGALYETDEPAGVAHAEVIWGKEMSFNNYVDADAAWELVCDFEELACAIIKHTNPAGVGLGITAEEAYRKALATDPVSAFGGIVAFNRRVDESAAKAVVQVFTEVIIAPAYDETALDVLRAKKNLRVLRVVNPVEVGRIEYKQISGGMVVQSRDTHKLEPGGLKVVTARIPSEDELRALLFAWTVSKHTKSNAIVYARDGQTVGVGAGQMSRVDSVKIGAMRAQLPIKGSVLASDAFFPFRDGIDEAAKHGITAIIQPGGSVRDEETIAAANEHGLAMIFTSIRHFKH